MSERDYIESFLREELRLVNRHAPRSRISICELLEQEVPHVLTHNGSVHMMNPKEIVLLSELSGKDCNLKLPIILEYVPVGEGLYTVEDPVASALLARLLSLPSYTTPLQLHRPQVLEIRRVLRTTTVILISPRFLSLDTG